MTHSSASNYKAGQNSDRPRLYFPDDEDFVRELIYEMIRRKRYVKRPSKYQIKHRAVNFFYTTGVITVDGQGRHYETGAEAFLKLIDQRYPKHRGLGPMINPFADLTLSQKLRLAPVIDVSLDDVDDLCHDNDRAPAEPDNCPE